MRSIVKFVALCVGSFFIASIFSGCGARRLEDNPKEVQDQIEQRAAKARSEGRAADADAQTVAISKKPRQVIVLSDIVLESIDIKRADNDFQTISLYKICVQGTAYWVRVEGDNTLQVAYLNGEIEKCSIKS